MQSPDLILAQILGSVLSLMASFFLLAANTLRRGEDNPHPPHPSPNTRTLRGERGALWRALVKSSWRPRPQGRLTPLGQSGGEEGASQESTGRPAPAPASRDFLKA